MRDKVYNKKHHYCSILIWCTVLCLMDELISSDYTLCFMSPVIRSLVSAHPLLISSSRSSSLRKHAYSNTLKYTENFTREKFSDKNSDILHISAQNIDRGYC